MYFFAASVPKVTIALGNGLPRWAVAGVGGDGGGDGKELRPPST